ncbi:MAG: DNA adenine methylase [Desulfovibrio sp.]|nr:DNA adenine methylase [Desulfovibrio sp.]
MNNYAPRIVQYQGSKRKLAPQILSYMPKSFKRLIEPFSGMAAISIAVALEQRTKQFIINDINKPLIIMLEEAIEYPDRLLHDYLILWKEQFTYKNHVQHFYDVREKFNKGFKTPANMLYLIARCVKGSVRYGKNGNLNQSPDKRRHGTQPNTLQKNIYNISYLLKGKTKFYSYDYKRIFEIAEYGDVVYMDPPYQGVTNVRDNRYVSGVEFDEFSEALKTLNKNKIDYLISYDGICGSKKYGKSLPKDLECQKVFLNAGISTQSTLLGKSDITYESLYISKYLIKEHKISTIIQQRPLIGSG